MLKLNEIEIAYPQSPALVSLAEKLKSGLASYRIPSSVVKKTGIKSLADVKEPWLIVLCAPETPSCGEVTDRILEFRSKGLYDHILTLLVSGEPAGSFPKELLFETLPDGRVVSREPLAANITAGSERESLRLLAVEKLRLLAPILGVSFDELRNRRRQSLVRAAAAVAAVVLTAAAVFLSYALSRRKVISAQNESLNLELAQAEEARDLARQQRDAAREDFAATTAIRAREVLDDGDSELALLLCLDFLPEYGLSTELPAILRDALDGLCKKGYVSVTSLKEYSKDRYEPLPPKKEESGIFPKTITRPIPEGCDNDYEDFDLELELSSEEFGYAVYWGSFNYSKTSSAKVYRTLVCFKDDLQPEYYIAENKTSGVWLTPSAVLGDGSFIGTEHHYPHDFLFRYDPFKAEFMPFYDDTEGLPAPGAEVLPADPAVCREAGIYSGEAPGEPTETEKETISPYPMISGIRTFMEKDGAEGLIFGQTRTSDYDIKEGGVRIYVFSKEPFRYLYTVDDVIDLILPENSSYLIGVTGKKLLIFRTDPFRFLYTLEDEATYQTMYYHYAIPAFPDGREWLYVSNGRQGKFVYDLADGRLMSVFKYEGQDYDYEIADDGMILSSIKNKPVLWDPVTETVIREIPDGEDDSPDLMGDIDEATGRRSADAVRVYDKVFIYREEAIEVPEDLAGQIELAKRLLNGRALTKKERKTYSLQKEGGGE